MSDQVSQYKRGKAPVISYTDDSAMTIQLAKSLIQCKGFDAKDMAQRCVLACKVASCTYHSSTCEQACDISNLCRFTEEFFSSPERGYGSAVATVFVKLKESKYSDVFGPAAQQFKGTMCKLFYTLPVSLTLPFSISFPPSLPSFLPFSLPPLQGEGSCGNGAAMRVSPVAIYGYNNDQLLIEVTHHTLIKYVINKIGSQR